MFRCDLELWAYYRLRSGSFQVVGGIMQMRRDTEKSIFNFIIDDK